MFGGDPKKTSELEMLTPRKFLNAGHIPLTVGK